MSQFSISNIENYNKTLASAYEDCIVAFKNTIYKYFLHYSLISQEKSLTFDVDTLIVGINTIECIFSMLLLKTKNLSLVVQNSENTIFYFFEFIEQMKRPRTELQSLLNLTTMDAKLFVYKKTIFDLQVKKTTYTKEENEIFCKFKEFAVVYKKFLTVILVAKNVNEIIDEFDELNSYIKKVFIKKPIDDCLAIDISTVNKNNLLNILEVF